jgi:hypothetical protein
MGDELDRCFALLAGEGEKASEEVVIRKARREREDVRVHGPCVSRAFSGLSEGSQAGRGASNLPRATRAGGLAMARSEGDKDAF